jgi:hypothetical protein
VTKWRVARVLRRGLAFIVCSLVLGSVTSCGNEDVGTPTNDESISASNVSRFEGSGSPTVDYPTEASVLEAAHAFDPRVIACRFDRVDYLFTLSLSLVEGSLSAEDLLELEAVALAASRGIPVEIVVSTEPIPTLE